MSKSLTIYVSDEIIKNSERSNTSRCMIAQAIRKKGMTSVNVTAESVMFNDDENRYFYPLPAYAAEKLVQFDRNPDFVHPFRLRLSGSTAFSRPIMRYPNRKKRGPTRKYTAPTVKRCKRRFHGLRVIQVKSVVQGEKT